MAPGGNEFDTPALELMFCGTQFLKIDLRNIDLLFHSLTHSLVASCTPPDRE